MERIEGGDATVNKKALITGITGQDGAYMAELLLSKGYKVFGLKRRSSIFNTKRIDHLYKDPHNSEANLVFYYGDLTDSTNLIRIIQETQPDEIYNFAAQSHVKVSFDVPEYTADVDALGVLRLLEAIRILKLEKKTKFFQASTSELFGNAKESPQNENTPFNPCSPYSVAKLYAHKCVINYRNAYNIFASNGISFNHESPIRGETFVTRKITIGAAKIVLDLQDKIYLGNLDSKRDWGHAKDYVRGMWLMLQQDKSDDYVLSTGKQHSVREFCEIVFKAFGIGIEWRGKGLDEKGIITNIKRSDVVNYWAYLKIGDEVICIDPSYYRPTDVNNLLGDSTKAFKELGWKPEIPFEKMVREMVTSDFAKLSRKYNNKNKE